MKKIICITCPTGCELEVTEENGKITVSGNRCPRGVEPAKLVEAVRLMAVRKQGANHMTPDCIPAMVDEDTPQQLLVSAFRKYTKESKE